MVAKLLSQKKKYGLSKIRDECMEERSMKHKYNGRFPCDKDDGHSLYVLLLING